ncbi:uncharacterized protein [Haliotis asinina]|uniref:uncharacterized protein n=1 Tax=Haliotis asinina TaxID=109174 RepID=UPI003531F648
MTLHHLFRNAEHVTVMNKLGHVKNYSFLLEIETAVAVATQQTTSILPTTIVREPTCPSLFHSDYDNYDEFINELEGSGSVHRSHGTMMQELLVAEEEDPGGTQPVLVSIPRTRERTLKQSEAADLPECYIAKRRSPGYKVINKAVDGGKEAYEKIVMKNMLWLLIRPHAAKTSQSVPGWGGFVSLTGKTPLKLTTIEYYPIIPHPITDYKAVKECLSQAEKGTGEVGQQYVITTFDLGVCMKAYPLVWTNPNRYADHIIMIGTFHLACAYLKMIGKKMAGTGLDDILLEAGLISSGSLSSVLSGKNYVRAINCHKTLLEALEHLLLLQFLAARGDESPLSGLPQESKIDDAIIRYLSEYLNFRNAAREGELGKTAQLWLSYMNHVWLVLRLLQAVKTNDYLAYAECIGLMADLFFSFDGQNYARYVTFFAMFIANIEESHPGATELLKRGAISVARSFIPGNRCAVDKTIQETFMKHAKSRGGSNCGSGFSGILTNYGAYQRWTQSSKERAQYLQAAYSMADMVPESVTGEIHRDVRRAEVLKGERRVAKTAAAINSFNNPFNTAEKGKVYSLSSGAPASSDVENDILRTDTIGAESKSNFIQDRLEKKEKFFEPIKELRLKTMADMNKSVLQPLIHIQQTPT